MENCKLADAKRNTSTLLNTSKKDEANASPNLRGTYYEERCKSKEIPIEKIN